VNQGDFSSSQRDTPSVYPDKPVHLSDSEKRLFTQHHNRQAKLHRQPAGQEARKSRRESCLGKTEKEA